MFLIIVLAVVAIFIGYMYLRVSLRTDHGMTAIPLFVFFVFSLIVYGMQGGMSPALAVGLGLFGSLAGAVLGALHGAISALNPSDNK